VGHFRATVVGRAPFPEDPRGMESPTRPLCTGQRIDEQGNLFNSGILLAMRNQGLLISVSTGPGARSILPQPRGCRLSGRYKLRARHLAESVLRGISTWKGIFQNSLNSICMSRDCRRKRGMEVRPKGKVRTLDVSV
jgi:hypothetical protein